MTRHVLAPQDDKLGISYSPCMPLATLKTDLRSYVDPKKAAFFPRFFKAGPGEYAEGDKFLGITVPQMRTVAKRHRELTLTELKTLLQSGWHEERLTALLILVDQYKRGDKTQRKTIVDFYLSQTKRINNWDLVDLTAAAILGDWLHATGSTKLLDKLARSKDLWEQRIAMVATHAFIRARDFGPTVRIAESLLRHEHDLIHKASGWMLREMGKRDLKPLKSFLQKHASVMPRTMLRYAIERLPEAERKKILLSSRRTQSV